MAIRVDAWRFHGRPAHGDWSTRRPIRAWPYISNLLMDRLEKVIPIPKRIGTRPQVRRPEALVPTAAGPFLAEHLTSCKRFPPSQGSDTLSMRKAVEAAMKKLDSPLAAATDVDLKQGSGGQIEARAATRFRHPSKWFV